MNFAADAVFDVVAPPARPANARAAAPRDESEPSFDDHLEATSADEAPRDAKPRDGDKAEAIDATEANTDVAVETSPAPVAPTPPPATPHVIQIVETAAPTVNTENADAAPSIAPVEAARAPQTAAPPEPAAPVAAPSADAGTGERSSAPEIKSEAAPKHAAPNTKPQADTSQPAATNTAPAVQQAAAPQATVLPLEAAEAPPPEAATAAVAPIAVERPAPLQRNGKSDTARDAKQLADAGEAKTEAPTPNAPQTQKSASSNAAGKDALPAALAIQAGAPEIPAPSAQTGAAPFAQASTQTHQGAAIDHTAAVRAAPAASQVAHEIIRRFNGGNTTFDLRLDPPELGRVEVRLDVSRDHRVTAVISADSPQALTELSRHAHDLEQMLNDAGLQLSDSGLSFDLRQGSEGNGDASETDSRGRAAQSGDDATQQQTSIAARPLGFERWRGVRVDVTV